MDEHINQDQPTADRTDAEADSELPDANATTERPRVLVPVEVLEGESIPEGVHELLANAVVVLLGYHVLPDQTPPGQARHQFEERAQRQLEQFQADFEAAGAVVESRLVFTHKAQQTIDRKIAEHDCLAVLVPNAGEPPEDVLVAVRGTTGVARIGRLVAGLFANTSVSLTLYHAISDGEQREDAETLLDGVKSRLIERGVERSSIGIRVDDDGDGIDAIADAATAYDAVIMGESDPSVATFVFGMPSKKVADRFLGPVLVVQRERPR
ncbi:universal stress protein [Halobacteria archaeon AArc-dxtr1]|nr:universal stress protein [Halobacteria archaeon AArc-dxtr1]